MAILFDTEGHIRCPFCSEKPVLKPTAAVYGKHYGCPGAKMWVCDPCGARVGCHGDSDKPLGNLADAATRAARMAAHAAFDPLWKGTDMKRSAAYLWLSERLGMDPKDCHISQMGVEGCQRVVEACEARLVVS